MGVFLFNLVKSLSKNEIGVITKKAHGFSRNKIPKHVHLLNAYLAMKEYNKDHLLDILKGEISEKQLFVNNNYLTNAIMETLADIEDDEVIRLRRQMDYIKVLIGKSFYKEGAKRIRALKKQINQAEYFSLYQQLLEMELSLAKGKPDIEWMQQVYLELNELIEIQKNLLVYRQYLEQLEIFFWKSKESKASRKKLDEMFKNPMIADELNTKSNTAKAIYHKIWAGYSYINGDNDKNFMHLQKAIESLSANPSLLKANMEEFIRLSFNVCMYHAGQGNLDELEYVITNIQDELEALPGNMSYYKAMVQTRKCMYVIECMAKMERYDDAMKFISTEIDIDDDVWDGFDYYKMLVLMHVSYIQLMNGKHRASLKSLNEIQFDIDENIREDLWVYSKFMICCIHLDQLKQEHLEVSIKNMLGLQERLAFDSPLLTLFLEKVEEIEKKGLNEKMRSRVYRSLVKSIDTASLNFTDKEFIKDYNIIKWMRKRLSSLRTQT